MENLASWDVVPTSPVHNCNLVSFESWVPWQGPSEPAPVLRGITMGRRIKRCRKLPSGAFIAMAILLDLSSTANAQAHIHNRAGWDTTMSYWAMADFTDTLPQVLGLPESATAIQAAGPATDETAIQRGNDAARHAELQVREHGAGAEVCSPAWRPEFSADKMGHWLLGPIRPCIAG
jgi:hypothetical protein